LYCTLTLIAYQESFKAQVKIYSESNFPFFDRLPLVKGKQRRKYFVWLRKIIGSFLLGLEDETNLPSIVIYP
jgi:hypothetical protein